MPNSSERVVTPFERFSRAARIAHRITNTILTLDENYKRSIKSSFQRQIKKMRSREELKLLEENSKRRRQAKQTKGRQRRHFDANDDEDGDEWQGVQKMRPQAQLNLDAAKRAAKEKQAAEDLANGEDSELATVISVGRDRVRVLDEQSRVHEVELTHDGVRPAVGDDAVLVPLGASAGVLAELQEPKWRLRALAPRRSVISRPDPGNPNVELVLAANIDVAIIVASVLRPVLKPALIDRFLIAIERGGARPLLCINKSDLMPDEAEREEVRRVLATYASLGVEILWTSAESGEGIDDLVEALSGLTCVFVGHSGVGKSTLLNALDPASTRDTGSGREFDGKGRHTTSSSQLVELPGGTRLVDTPGIRSLGLWKVAPGDLWRYFPDFEGPAEGCRFRDCLHVSEPDCGVRAALEDGAIASERFATYLRILETLAS